MSNRTLIEINHDFASHLDENLARTLRTYLNSASRQNAEMLQGYGMRVIGMRHHSGKFILDGEPDGFPVSYLPPAKP